MTTALDKQRSDLREARRKARNTGILAGGVRPDPELPQEAPPAKPRSSRTDRAEAKAKAESPKKKAAPKKKGK